jgi:hypothetical protein
MAAHRIRPENLEERLVYWAVLSTWGLWLLGATFVVFPMLGWLLAALAIARRLGWLPTAPNNHPRPSPIIVSAWLTGMALMLVALIVGHIDYEMSLPATVKSTLGWVKGWALFAVWPLVGAMTQIRARLVFRAFNMLGLQTLLITPLLIMSALVGLPDTFYVSPLQKIVGSEAIFYTVGLHMPDSGMLGFRLRYFAPWAPAAAFFGVTAFVLAMNDRHPVWRAIGIAAAVSMCFFSLSRLALVAIPAVLLATWAAANMLRPAVLMTVVPLVVVATIMGETVHQVLLDAEAAFSGARADSSRVRAIIQNIGIHRWLTEAFWFGHAVVERGPHIVEYMPIGSHHTWIGLLFVKGLVGLLACLLPLLWTVIELAVRCIRDRVSRAAFGCMVVFALFSFGENVDVLGYLIWPTFLMIGIAARRRISLGIVSPRLAAKHLYRVAKAPAPVPGG